MKVVVAPDKFAGTLSASDAAEEMAAGWRRARPQDEVVVVPMADGGEGTIEVLAAALPEARREEAEVADARGIATRATWLLLPDGRAFIEAAQACGLSVLPPAQRNPRENTSYGVGQLLRAAVDHGVDTAVIGLGGSATVDGGAGLATALGNRLLRRDRNGVKVGGEHLRYLDRVEAVPPPPVEVIVAADVQNPLLGPAGAVAVYAPQKGAGPEDLPVLEEALRRWADVVERDLPGAPWRDLPGAGAAGGLAFGLAGFCGAKLGEGAAVVGGLCGLPAALEGADVVVTGEGRLDAQTLQGKAPAYVAEQARKAGAVVLAVAGEVVDAAANAFDRALDLGPQGLSKPRELVRERAAQLAAEVGER